MVIGCPVVVPWLSRACPVLVPCLSRACPVLAPCLSRACPVLVPWPFHAYHYPVWRGHVYDHEMK
eukprot:9999514-Lingulodinium_polyedra.AAC.1